MQRETSAKTFLPGVLARAGAIRMAGRSNNSQQDARNCSSGQTAGLLGGIRVEVSGPRALATATFFMFTTTASPDRPVCAVMPLLDGELSTVHCREATVL